MFVLCVCVCMYVCLYGYYAGFTLEVNTSIAFSEVGSYSVCVYHVCVHVWMCECVHVCFYGYCSGFTLAVNSTSIVFSNAISCGVYVCVQSCETMMSVYEGMPCDSSSMPT
jgi:hypothetical protein